MGSMNPVVGLLTTYTLYSTHSGPHLRFCVDRCSRPHRADARAARRLHRNRRILDALAPSATPVRSPRADFQRQNAITRARSLGRVRASAFGRDRPDSRSAPRASTRARSRLRETAIRFLGALPIVVEKRPRASGWTERARTRAQLGASRTTHRLHRVKKKSVREGGPTDEKTKKKG
eukprot:30999-Pelagococcus_subviridis.AAC.13